MLTTLDNLPTELLSEVTREFALLDKARLSLCNQNLFQRFRFLWATPSFREAIMREACQAGDLEMINQAIVHGQSKSFVRNDKQAEHLKIKSRSRMILSTLYLTAHAKKEYAFIYLLDIGANLKDGEQIDTLALRPIFNTDIRYLEWCFAYGSDALQKDISGFNALGSLARWISLGISAGVLDKILSYNPHANRIMPTLHGTSHTPLGAAVHANRMTPVSEGTSHKSVGTAIRTISKDVFNVLLNHDTCVHGKHFSDLVPVNRYHHAPMHTVNNKIQLPVFDAVNSVIEHSNESFLVDAINAGANIRSWGQLNNTYFIAGDDYHVRWRQPITPVLYFLLRHKDWKPDLQAMDIARHMVDHGARLNAFLCCRRDRLALNRGSCNPHDWVEKLIAILWTDGNTPQLPAVLAYLTSLPRSGERYADPHRKHYRLWRYGSFVTVDPGRVR